MQLPALIDLALLLIVYARAAFQHARSRRRGD